MPVLAMRGLVRAAAGFVALCCALPALAQEVVLIPNRVIYPGETVSADALKEVTLKPGMVGTDVSIVQKGIPDSIPVEFCYLGWQESLEMLAKLVEPEIPDGA